MSHHERIDDWIRRTDREQRFAIFSLLLDLEERLMTVSAQVQSVLDKVTQTESLEQSVLTAIQAQGSQITNLNTEIADLQAQLAAGGTIGTDDLAALATIGQDLDDVNSGLASAIPANTSASGSSSGSGSSSASPAAPVAPFGTPNAPTGMPGSAEQTAANGPSNHPAGGSAPLMPTIAFDPNPTATAAALAVGKVPSTIQTPGGFVTNPINPNPADPVTMGAAGDVAPSSVVPNVAGGQTVLAGQVAPGARISNTGGVESATDADGVPLAASENAPAPGSAATTSPSVSPAAAAAAGGNPNAAPFDPSAPPPAGSPSNPNPNEPPTVAAPVNVVPPANSPSANPPNPS